MYIRWGISSIGRRANYVMFEGPTPNPPTNLTATAASDVEMWVKWQDRSAIETGYKVYRSPDGVSDWTKIATLPKNSSQYLDSGLTKNTRYYYRALAYNAEGNSSYSNIDDDRTWKYPPERVYLPLVMRDE
jgi:titin